MRGSAPTSSVCSLRERSLAQSPFLSPTALDAFARACPPIALCASLFESTFKEKSAPDLSDLQTFVEGGVVAEARWIRGSLRYDRLRKTTLP